MHRHGFLGGHARFVEQRVALDVLVAHAHRRRQRAAGVELAAVAIDRGHREVRIRADQRLLDVRPLGRREVLLLVDELHERVDEARALDLERRVVDLQQQIHLRLHRHVERVLLDRRVPARLGNASTGASTTGSALILRLARAIATACAATRAISSFVTTLLLAKPHVPSTITRTPNP